MYKKHIDREGDIVERFDRIGNLGRCAITSLSALDAECLSTGSSPWPVLTHKLAAARLWAFGTLIGNTDMHSGNLSFITDQGPPTPSPPPTT